MNNITQQLAPSWSTVNIAITVVLFLMAWPFALIMIAYILWGQKLGLDFSKPGSLAIFGRRVATAFRAGIDSFTKG